MPDEDDAFAAGNASSISRKRRRLSIRERKDLKKGTKTIDVGPSSSSSSSSSSPSSVDVATKQNNNVETSSVSIVGTTMTTKKTKAKKKKKKKSSRREVSIHATASSSFNSSSTSLSQLPTSASSSSSSPSTSTLAQTMNTTTTNSSHLLESYAISVSDAEPPLLAGLRVATRSALPSADHMTSGPLQGRLLTSLVCLTGSTRILELGTFTGYATQCLAEGVMEYVGGKIEGTTTTITTKKKGVGAGPVVTSCEIDDEAATMAQTYFDQSKYGNIIELRRGPAMDTLRQLRTDIDEGRRVPYDMVFLDADKRSYREYYDYIIGSRLLKVGGVILADNVLFKGLVTNSPGFSGGGGNGAVVQQEKKPLNYWKRRHQDIADALHEFNDYVNKDDRSSVVLLPLRDGLSIIRKK